MYRVCGTMVYEQISEEGNFTSQVTVVNEKFDTHDGAQKMIRRLEDTANRYNDHMHTQKFKKKCDCDVEMIIDGSEIKK